MSLERRVLAKVDRRLLSELDHGQGVQLVKVPVSDAVWSTWRRYCEAAGVTMGRGLAILLEQELASVVGEDLEGLFERLDRREVALASTEAEVTERQQDLNRREQELVVRERKLQAQADRAPEAPSWTPPKRGRNQPCWCGSQKKFKYCHGKT